MPDSCKSKLYKKEGYQIRKTQLKILLDELQLRGESIFLNSETKRKSCEFE